MSLSKWIAARSVLRPVCLLAAFGVSVSLLAGTASAQEKSPAVGPEFSIGWSHMTGDFGLDGFNLEAGYWFTDKASVVFNYGDLYDNSPISAFALSSLGAARVKSRLQNFLIGPRFAFPGSLKGHSKVIPFGEALFGGSHLRSTISQAIPGQENASDSAFTWGIGGGMLYTFNPHWTGRINLDLVRTHFADAGQSRLRMVLGAGYSFGSH